MTDFDATRALFDLPPGITYLDGNSLGPLPRSVPERLARTLREEWGGDLVRAWNARGWMAMPTRLGDRIAPLIGAPAGSVTTGDTLSIRLHQALSAALDLAGDRRVILSDTGNFPSDLYIAQSLCRSRHQDHRLVTVAPEEVADHLSEEVAVLMLTEVDYRTGRRHDMAALSRAAREQGVATIWDLAHSAGALPIDVSGCGVDFAVGCTYKYLNAGPGGPAFIHAAPRHLDALAPALAGWLGHAAPFDFAQQYRPGAGIERLRIGTPPILQMAALDEALNVWDRADIHDVRRRSLALSRRLIDGVAAACPALALLSPTDDAARGSQVAFRHPQGHAIMQALIARDVIGDFRAPDILRFGITPLYIGPAEIDRAVTVLAEIMTTRAYDRPEYQRRAAVT